MPGGTVTPDFKKCIKCDRAHSSLATRCPTRKEIINKKCKAEEDKTNITYTNALKTNISTPFQHTPSSSGYSTVTPVTHTRIYQSMLHAHFINIGNPGSFSKTFNSLMKANNLPTLVIPEDPPSLEIITQLSKEESSTSNIQGDMDTDTRNQKEDEEASGTTLPRVPEISSTQKSTPSSGETKSKKKGEDAGIQIFTKQSSGWPQR